MKLLTTLIHRHHVLSRRFPAVPFLLSPPTTLQRQTLSPRLLQFRPSSSSSSDYVDFQKNLHRLIAAQRVLDRETKAGFTIREIVKRSGQLTPEQRKEMMDNYFDAETERWTIVRDMLKEEVNRVDPSDLPEIRRLAGPKRTAKIAQLILERAAEPGYRLRPDDLKMVGKAVLHIASKSAKGMTYMKVGGFALSAGVLYYVYNIFNWSP